MIEYYEEGFTPEMNYSTPGTYEDCDVLLQQENEYVKSDYYRRDLGARFGKFRTYTVHKYQIFDLIWLEYRNEPR